MALGVVRWFSRSKGFGFIERDDGNEVFVCLAAIKDKSIDTLSEGQEVIIDVIEGPKGLEAINVVKR